MNAVERLLSHGEQLVSLFDEMFIDRLGSGRPADLPDVPQGLLYTVGHSVITAMPTGQYWASAHWLQAAAEASWLELKKAKKRPNCEAVAIRTADLFRESLSQREHLLSDATWRRLLADVVFESRGWEPLAARVVSLAETVAEQVRQVGQVPGDIDPLEWERQERKGLRRALDNLHPYAQPPKPAGPPAKKQSTDSRSRSGRPQNDEALARDLLTGWRAYEPEDGRKTKDRYLAQRLDVQVLKTPEARERKIASLRVSLNSALHLSREKTKQKRRARG